MQLINWELLKNPYNWVVIWIIAAMGGLAVTAYWSAKHSTVN